MDLPNAAGKSTSASHAGWLFVAALALATGALSAALAPSPLTGLLTMSTGAALVALHAGRRTSAMLGLGLAVIVFALLLGIDRLTAVTVAVQLLAAVVIASELAELGRTRLLRAQPAPATALDTARDRLAVETALVETTRAILRDCDTLEVEAAMENLIRSVGCDLIMVSRNRATDESLEAHIVFAAGSCDGLLPSVSWSHLPHAASLLSTGRSHQFNTVEEIPMPDRLFYQNAPTRILAAAEFPIIVQGSWVGHVGLLATEGARRWEDSDLELLSTIADMLASVWQRERALDDLERVIVQRDRSLAIQTAITGSARVLFESGDEDVDSALDLILDALDGEVAYVKDVRPHGQHGVGLETRIASLAEGASMSRSLERGEWMSWPPVYAPILDTRPWIVSDITSLGQAQQRWYGQHLPSAASEIAFPIVTGGTVVGMIGVTASTPRDWGAGDIRTMATIAQMLGVARTRTDARRNLEDIVKAKDRFIASVSHELRTPMAVVMGLSSELNGRRQDFSEEEVAEFIDLIARQSREVGNIIEDLLVSARATAESITVLPELIRLDEVVNDALTSMSHEQTRRIASTDLTAVSTFADPLRVRQIIRNLVANGHRHGGTRVFIKVSTIEGAAVLEVSDDGPGVPAARRAEIFEAYSTGETQGRTASIGLGLTVSRQLARLMGGDVRYLHEPLPTFRLTLPVGAANNIGQETERALAG
ncbi:MAG: ATP-binding protein [Acidimicrobiia bacterium]